MTPSAPLGGVKRIGMCTLVLLLVLTGCGSKDPAPPSTGGPSTPATGSGSTSAKPSASATPTAGTLVEFSTDGAGPYLLGMTLAQLQIKPGVDEITVGNAACPKNTFARGTGVYRDVRLSFREDGKLYLVLNRSEAIPTPSGAYLGTTLADLKKIYANIQTQELTRGANSAFLVQTLGGGGILFDLDPAKKVVSMAAADAGYLRSTYTAGTDFC